MQIDETDGKFTKLELSYELRKCGQKDSQVSLLNSRKLLKTVSVFHIRDQPVSACVRWPNGRQLRRPVCKFELDQDKKKSTLVITSPCKSTQVAGETSLFGQGLEGLCTSRLLCSNHIVIMD